VEEPRVPGNQRDVEMLRGREVVRDASLRIGESEADRAFGGVADEVIDVGLAARDEPRAPMPAADRSLGDGGRARAADGDAEDRAGPRAFARAEVHFRARGAG